MACRGPLSRDRNGCLELRISRVRCWGRISRLGVGRISWIAPENRMKPSSVFGRCPRLAPLQLGEVLCRTGSSYLKHVSKVGRSEYVRRRSRKSGVRGGADVRS